mgnify:CR=1 FL=1
MNHIKLFEDFSVYTNDKFWGTIGAGILPIAKDTGRILVPLRSDYVNEPNTYGVWGGMLDDMETNDPIKAAKIEFKEESGYTNSIEVIPAFVFKKVDDNGNDIFRYHNYIGIIECEFTPVLDWESKGYEWLTFNELMDLEPKHFGLKSLIENSKELIRKYSK